MPTITFSCRVITPMFLTSALKSTVELRAPAIKGALRYWWRAFHADLNIGEMKRIEAIIFGGQPADPRSNPDKIGRSRIDIAVEPKMDNIKDHFLLPAHKENCMPAIDVDGSFDIHLKLKAIPQVGLMDAGKLEALFSLVTILGGIGKRSRKGSGNFGITEPVNGGQELKSYNLKDLFGFVECLNGDKYELDATDSVIKLAANTAILTRNYPYVKSIRLGKAYNDPEVLRTHIDQKIKSLHQGLSSKDNDAVEKPINGKQYSLTLGRYADSLGAGKPRFSAPVFFSIVRINSAFSIVATELNAAGPGTANSSLINDFIIDVLA